MSMEYTNFIYNAERRVIFAYIPKVACTNWKAVMRYLAGHKNYLDNRLAHDKVNGGLHYLDLSGPERALLSDPGIRKFTVVRDPYSRALSGYLNKVAHRLPVKPPAEGEDHFDKVLRQIDAFRAEKFDASTHPVVDFEVFLTFLRDSGSPFRNDEHWQKQSILLRWPEVKFDYIGRFENLNRDAPVILKEMGCDIPFPSQRDVRFKPTDATAQLARYFGPRTIRLVDEIFADDFNNFGYPHIPEDGQV